MVYLSQYDGVTTVLNFQLVLVVGDVVGVSNIFAVDIHQPNPFKLSLAFSSYFFIANTVPFETILPVR